MKKSCFVVVVCLLLTVSFVCAEKLSVASWNIKTIEVKKKNQIDEWKKRYLHTADYIQYQDYDVIGIQEATIVQIDSLLRQLPQYRYVGVASRDGKKNGNGNPIFYKHEKFDLLESSTFWLSETPNKPSMGWDANSKRICTWAAFREKVSGKKFVVFNIHLDHIGDEAQANGLNLVLDSLTKQKDVSIFLMGDFNVEKGSFVYNLVQEKSGLMNSYNVARKKIVASESFNANHFDRAPEKTVDFIFVNNFVDVLHYSVMNDVYWEAGKPHYYSDHFPVRILVNLVNKRL